MPTKPKKTTVKDDTLRKQILQSALASSKIEGIDISRRNADIIFKKVELNLGR